MSVMRAPDSAVVNRRLFGPDDPLVAPERGVFFGREKEVAAIVAFLRGGEPWGAVTAAPGVLSEGIGKSEVGKAGLRAYLSAVPGAAVHHVDLSSAESAVELLAALAQAAGAPQAASEKAVLSAIRASKGVYYLESLEEAGKDPRTRSLLVALRSLPGVRVLASTREEFPELGRSFPVGSLSVEHAAELFQRTWWTATGRALPKSDGLYELVGGAGARRGATLSGDAPRVTRSIDGHPLSILLVAGLAGDGTLDDLVDLWEIESLSTAERRGKETPSDVSSLDVACRCALAFLGPSPGIRLLWCLAALFPGGMSRAAWRELRGTAASEDDLSRLILANVLSWRGDMLRILPPLARFALKRSRDKRDGFDLDAALRAVSPYVRRLAGEADRQQRTERAAETRRALLLEFPVFHRFLRVAADAGPAHAPLVEELTERLKNFFQYRVLIGVDALRKVVEPGRLRSPLVRADALERLGGLENQAGELSHARIHYWEAIELYEKEGSDLGRANTLQSLGDLESQANETAAALENYRQAIALYEACGADLGRANALHGLGALERRLGETEAARRHYIEARSLYAKEKDDMGLAYACAGLARVKRALGEEAGVSEALDEADAAAERSGVPQVVVYVDKVRKELFG